MSDNLPKKRKVRINLTKPKVAAAPAPVHIAKSRVDEGQRGSILPGIVMVGGLTLVASLLFGPKACSSFGSKG